MVQTGEIYEMTATIETVYNGSPVEELERFEVFSIPARLNLEKCESCIEIVHTSEYCRDVIMVVEEDEFVANSKLVAK